MQGLTPPSINDQRQPPPRRRKWLRVGIGLALVAVLLYPVAGNLLLTTGVLERIISRKPEKLKVQWSSAWTLLPGRIYVNGFNLDIHSKKNHTQIDLGEAEIQLRLLSLIDKTVDIRSADVDGLKFSHTKLPKPAPPSTQPAMPGADAGGTSTAPTSNKPGKPPWIIQINDATAANVQNVRFNWFEVNGRGDLKNLTMRLVTKGGPLRIDKLDLDMKVAPNPDEDDAKYTHLEADISLAENIPKHNKGLKLLKFASGRLAVKGDASGIESINPLFRNKGKLAVAGGGELDVLVMMKSGELLDGSRITFNPASFEADLPGFHAGGSGSIAGSIEQNGQNPKTLKINVSDLDLDVETSKNRIHATIGEALIDLSLPPLGERTVDIQRSVFRGLRFSFTPNEESTPDDAVKKAKESTGDAVPAPVADTGNPATTVASGKDAKPPWTIQIKNTSVRELKSMQFKDFRLGGIGDLREFAMRLVTKGGPLRIDKLDLDMKVSVDPDVDPSQDSAKFANLKVDLKLAENIPGESRGKKLLKFISGRMEITGDASSIEFINPLLSDKYQVAVGGGGELDVLAIIESGELMHGSKIDFDSDNIQTYFLDLHATGTGNITGRIDSQAKEPVSFKISVTDFRLNRRGIPNPYMEGADLFVTLQGKRYFLDRAHEDEKIFVDFPNSILGDLTDYNRFIPKQANIEILSGSGDMNGTMFLASNSGHINLNLNGTGVVLDVNGSKLSTDLKLVTNLTEGKYGKKSYNLAGTSFRLDGTQLATEKEQTKSDWWGEIEFTKGDLIWTEPMDIDAQMNIRMRDTEPLITLLRDANKRKSLLDRAMTIKGVEGTIGIQTNDKNILLDPILINGKGLQVISRLDVQKDSMDGAIYVKLHGIPVNFEINNNKAKFKGLGGKKKVKRQVNLEAIRQVPH